MKRKSRRAEALSSGDDSDMDFNGKAGGVR